MAVVHLRKNSIPAQRRWHGEQNEDSWKTVFRRFSYKHKMCYACCGFYGPSYGQPLCATCHAFLFPDDIDHPDGVPVFQEKSDSEDSGNEEPSDFYETLPRRQERPRLVLMEHPKPDKLAECISALSTPRAKETINEEILENLPTEVLAVIFSFLDDLSLWSCAQVCKRWFSVIEIGITQKRWRHFTRRRWPLFKPTFSVQCWAAMYTKLVHSSPCLLCLQQMTEQSKPPPAESSWRTIRLRNELKSLHSDPPEGIEATPLDKSCCHWQASISGPADSPYEGGNFFLYIQIPHNYPMRPPIVRFITKIFHPNVSRHGDIGIDSIHDNWSLALTISKILISIQSLLTDPYCHVCMEPEVGRLYQENRAAFDGTARLWTVRYAMFNKRPPLNSFC